MAKVFLIDHDSVTRSHISSVMQSDKEINFIGDSDQYNNKLDIINADVLLIEISQNFGNAEDIIKNILLSSPTIKIIALSDELNSPKFLKMIFEAGITGYMTKNASAAEIRYGIDKVLREGLYICTAYMLKYINSLEQDEFTSSNSVYEFSEGERAVLLLIAEGLTNNDIAQKLMISVRTIETRRYRLLEKTGTSNTATLIRFCMRNGLIH